MRRGTSKSKLQPFPLPGNPIISFRSHTSTSGPKGICGSKLCSPHRAGHAWDFNPYGRWFNGILVYVYCPWSNQPLPVLTHRRFSLSFLRDATYIPLPGYQSDSPLYKFYLFVGFFSQHSYPFVPKLRVRANGYTGTGLEPQISLCTILAEHCTRGPVQHLALCSTRSRGMKPSLTRNTRYFTPGDCYSCLGSGHSPIAWLSHNGNNRNSSKPHMKCSTKLTICLI